MPASIFKPSMSSGHTSGIFADTSVDGPVIGDLVVVIDRARNLPNRKTMGKQDPYCAARLGKEAKKTHTDKRGGQTPKWDQELRFTVSDSPDYLKLKLSIFNDDKRTDLIGEAWIDLEEVIVRGGGQHDGWHMLNCKGRPAGEVRLEITYYDTREREEKVPEPPAPKKSRDTEAAGGPRGAPFKRRPLPKGPLGSEPLDDRAAPAPLESSHSRPGDRKPVRHSVIGNSNGRPVDPYEYRHKMMIEHGLPFDPHAPAGRQRHSYNGGPRPVPGQGGFSDLDKLHYRNRGVEIPEPAMKKPKPSDGYQAVRERQSPLESTQLPPMEPFVPPSSHVRNSYHTQDAQRDHQQIHAHMAPSNMPDVTSEQYQRHYDIPQLSPVGNSQSQYDQPSSYREPPLLHMPAATPTTDYHPQLPYPSQNTFIPDYPSNNTSQGDPPTLNYLPSDLTRHESTESYQSQDISQYQSLPPQYEAGDYHYQEFSDHQPYVSEEEPPPPLPPVHRTNFSSTGSFPRPSHQSYSLAETQESSFSQGLANLDDEDIYKPPESMTQLTTMSEPVAPASSGYHQSYNHGHRPHRQLQARYDHPPPSHQRSVQNMHDYSAHASYNHQGDPMQPAGRPRRGSFEPSTAHQEDNSFSDSPRPTDQCEYHQPVDHAGSGQAMQLYQLGSQSQNAYITHAHRLQHTNPSPSHPSPVDVYPEQHYHRASAPLVKPRPISPNVQSASLSTPPSSSISRKSVSPQPETGNDSPKLQGVAFSPDSFDVFNPQVRSRTSNGNMGTMTQLSYNTAQSGQASATNTPSSQESSTAPRESDDPIRDSRGRLVDPSDHLPTHTWAPEPEAKKPLKPESQLRFRGAVPMPARAPRAPRPEVHMPPVKSSVQSAHLTDKPAKAGASVDEKTIGGRGKLQKKVRIMMTSGGRKEQEAERRTEREGQHLNQKNGLTEPLRDIPNVNYGNGGSTGKGGNPPPIPAKVPIEEPGYEENQPTMHAGSGAAMGGYAPASEIDGLSREISSIDLGTSVSGGGRNRRSRFPTTLM